VNLFVKLPLPKHFGAAGFSEICNEMRGFSQRIGEPAFAPSGFGAGGFSEICSEMRSFRNPLVARLRLSASGRMVFGNMRRMRGFSQRTDGPR